MLPLDDEDIVSLVEAYKLNPEDQSFELLKELWRMLIN